MPHADSSAVRVSNPDPGAYAESRADANPVSVAVTFRAGVADPVANADRPVDLAEWSRHDRSVNDTCNTDAHPDTRAGPDPGSGLDRASSLRRPAPTLTSLASRGSGSRPARWPGLLGQPAGPACGARRLDPPPACWSCADSGTKIGSFGRFPVTVL